jgi:2'-5' RNA ligase
MKYLKLITEPAVAEGHITFLYFGKNAPDVLFLITEISMITRPFTLKYAGEDMYGDKHDIPVITYNVMHQDTPDRVRHIIREKCDPQVRAETRAEWHPHISNLTEKDVKEKGIDTLHVIGIESNDGTFFHLFPTYNG